MVSVFARVGLIPIEDLIQPFQLAEVFGGQIVPAASGLIRAGSAIVGLGGGVVAGEESVVILGLVLASLAAILLGLLGRCVGVAGGLGLLGGGGGRILLAGLLVELGELLRRSGLGDLDDLLLGLGAVGSRLLVVAGHQHVFDLGPRLQLQAGQVDLLGHGDLSFRLLVFPEVAGDQRLAPLGDAQDERLHAKVVDRLDHQRHPGVAGHLDAGRGGDEPDAGDLVAGRVDVVQDRVGIDLAARRLELDRVGAVRLDAESAREPVGILAAHRHGDGALLAEVEVARLGRLVGPGVDRDHRPFDGIDHAAFHAEPIGHAGVGRELVVERHPGDHRRGQDMNPISARLGVAAGDVVQGVLLDVPDRRLPLVVGVRPRCELLLGEEAAFIDARPQDDLLGADPLDLDRERDVGPGHDVDQLGVVAGLDRHEPGVGGAHHVGQEGPLGRVHDALGRDHHVQADQDDEPQQGVERPEHPALIDDPVEFDLGQVPHRLRLDRTQGPLGQLVAVLAEFEITDEAVLEGRVQILDRLGGVEPVHPLNRRADDAVVGE
ncbi:hypothetical protein TA3x_000879 [Tundrisphaera sp. TA3]|uniref:hypothetical protein n=1 Tax=Tundrisphaera sp. TA3 TaxID=3435775 RepID=UPI003EBB9B39